jgi:hypothetical protein
LFLAGAVSGSSSFRTAGLPGLQHGGAADAAASARHHHAGRESLMAGWYEGSEKANLPKTNSHRSGRLRELLAEWWRRIRRS